MCGTTGYHTKHVSMTADELPRGAHLKTWSLTKRMGENALRDLLLLAGGHRETGLGTIGHHGAFRAGMEMKRN